MKTVWYAVMPAAFGWRIPYPNKSTKASLLKIGLAFLTGLSGPFVRRVSGFLSKQVT
ncbi:MAG: hypothetical protein NXI04_22035 [Planctomycetaceae bacterium]|nr:hypothetical protein [Planctomycetaceae bacterium]